VPKNVELVLLLGREHRIGRLQSFIKQRSSSQWGGSRLKESESRNSISRCAHLEFSKRPPRLRLKKPCPEYAASFVVCLNTTTKTLVKNMSTKNNNRIAQPDRHFGSLAKGGQVQVPLGQTPFSSRFGMVADRLRRIMDDYRGAFRTEMNLHLAAS
jgi:uncharacterized glyoxalase superfamily protein PhnB